MGSLFCYFSIYHKRHGERSVAIPDRQVHDAWPLCLLGITTSLIEAPRDDVDEIITMTKSQLRTEHLAKRRQLTADEYSALNRGLLEQFQQLDLSGIKMIHLFLPIIENNEPNTYLIRDHLKETHPQIKIVFPQTDFRTLTMKSYADDADLVIEKNRYNIPEPVSGNEVDIEEIDLVILPMLVFDQQGYRVGYGKGFYDRFCAQCTPGTQFIGLSLFEPVVVIEDVDQYDIRMHACITPTLLYKWQ